MIAEDGEALRLSKIRSQTTQSLFKQLKSTVGSQAAVGIVLKEEDGGSLAYKHHFSQASTRTAPQLCQVRPWLELSSSVTWGNVGRRGLRGAFADFELDSPFFPVCWLSLAVAVVWYVDYVILAPWIWPRWHSCPASAIEIGPPFESV